MIKCDCCKEEIKGLSFEIPFFSSNMPFGTLCKDCYNEKQGIKED